MTKLLTGKLTREQAIALSDSKFWETMSYKERAVFQLFEPLLCMPFGVFHEAMEKTLGRPVFTHEFGLALPYLKKEILGEIPPPTFEQIIEMIPAEKRVILYKDEDAVDIEKVQPKQIMEGDQHEN